MKPSTHVSFPSIRAAAFATVSMTSLGHAANQTWIDANANAEWNSSLAGTPQLNWDSGIAWTQGNSAIFGGTGETVTLTEAISAGGLTFNSTGYTIAGSNTLTLAPGSVIHTAESATINAAISGSATKTGSGNLTISTLNAGATLILNEGTTVGNTGDGIRGTLQINADATFQNSTPHIFSRPDSRIWVNGGTLAHAGSPFPEYYISSGASGADPGLQMTGGTLSGGDTRYDSGAAFIRINAAATTATINANLYHFQAGSQTYNVVGGTVPDGVDLLVGGNLEQDFFGGQRNVTKDGAGLMEMTGRPILTGNGIFNLDGGTLRLTGTNAVTNFGTTSSSVALHASNAITLQLNAANVADSLTFSKNISGGSGAAKVSKIGPGKVTLSGAKTYTANTEVLAGTLHLAGDLGATTVTVANGGTFGGIGTAGTVNVANGGILEGGTSGTGTLTAGNVTIGTVNTDTATLKGSLSTTSGYKALSVTNLTLNGGSQKVTLDAAGVGLSNGTAYDLLVSTNPITAPNAASVLATLKSNSRAYTPLVGGSGTKLQLLYDANASIYWVGTSSAWNPVSTNSWKLTGNNQFTTFQANDTVFFHDNPVSADVSINDADVNPQATVFDNTTATEYSVTGDFGIATGTITKSGNGLVGLYNAANPTTGAVNLNGGTLVVWFPDGLGSGPLNFNGGTLQYDGTSPTWSRAINMNGGGKIDVIASQISHTGNLTGSGALTKDGDGTLSLGGANSYAGVVTISEGTLQLNQAAAVGTGTITLGDPNTDIADTMLIANAGSGAFNNPITVSANGSGTATLRQSQNFSTLAGLITLNRPTTLSATSGDRSGITGKITGNVGTLTSTGGRTTLDQPVGNASDFTGNVVVASGTLQMNTPYGIPSTASVTANGYFRPVVGIGLVSIDGLNGTGVVNNNSGRSGGDPSLTSVISLGNNGSGGSFTGTLQNGAGNDILAITKNGNGVQTLGGTAITYTGATTVNGGTLELNGTTSFASSAVTVNGGTLRVNNSSGTGTGSTATVTVNAGGTLGGAGSVGGSASIAAGATLAPGNNGAGTLGANNLSLSGTCQIQLDAATGDLVAVTGTLTTSGSPVLNVSTIGTPAAASYTILTYGTLSGSLPTVTGIPSGYTLDTATPGIVRLLQGGSPFDAWAAANIANPADRDPLDDPDKDGLANNLEFVTNGNPTDGTITSLPTLANSGTNMVFTFTRRDDAESLNPTVEFDADLAGVWTTAVHGSNCTIVVTENGSSPDSVAVTIPKGGNPKLFARLKVAP